MELVWTQKILIVSLADGGVRFYRLMNGKNMPNNFYQDLLKSNEPYIIADIGANHNGDVNLAKKMIDQALGDSDPIVSGEIKAAMALLPQAGQANTVMTLNLLRFWGMVKAMAPVPLPDIPVNTKSSIVIATKSDNGKFSVDVVVPKAHAIEIRDVVLGVMMQSKSAQQ